jgi:hypothetical protein
LRRKIRNPKIDITNKNLNNKINIYKKIYIEGPAKTIAAAFKTIKLYPAVWINICL